MPTSSSIRALQERFGSELSTELAREAPTAELEAALLDENHPLAKDLRTAVMAAVDVGRNTARQIVITALERVLRERADGR